MNNPSEQAYRFGFIIEQTLGHISHGETLRRLAEDDPTVRTSWGLPAWEGGVGAKIPLLSRNWTVRAGLQTRALLAGMQRQHNPQVLFFHTQVTAVLARDWLKRIPAVISLDATPRQIDSLGAAYQHKTGTAWLENWKHDLNRNSLREARHLVAWSQWTRRSLVDDYGVPDEKVSVIPPGVDLKAWEGNGPGRPARETGTLEPVKILFVGGDFERKGGDLLLAAFRSLRQQLVAAGPGKPPVELHLVTSSPRLPEPGVYVYNGLKPNSTRLKRLYQECHIFCLPTRGDCLPMVLSEAGAAGLPLVSTPLAGIPEIVVDGETGLLAPLGDIRALVAILWKLVTIPSQREYLGQRAHALVKRDFNAVTNVQRLLELLKEQAQVSRNGKEAG